MEEIEKDADLSIARDHAERPRNWGIIEAADGHARIKGPCGDTMEFWVTVEAGRLEEVRFVTDGCGSSLACGSMATTLAQGRLVEEGLELAPGEILDALGGLPHEFEHCALLASNTIRAACRACLSSPGRGGDQETRKTGIERREGESEEDYFDRLQLHSRMERIRNKIVVLSGKGGVGKTTVAVNLAVSLARAGNRVGLLDADIHGPSVPAFLGIEEKMVKGSREGLLPVEKGGVKVMSLGFMLSSRDEAIIWRGPRKTGVIKQFLKDVAWGELDFLVVDSPPGTGDEPLAVCQLLEDLAGAVLVTTPQRVAAMDVRKSVAFCRELKVPVIGVVENMSGFVCPKCGEAVRVFPGGGGKLVSEGMGVPFLGGIPLDPDIAEASDAGREFVGNAGESPAAECFRAISELLVRRDKGSRAEGWEAHDGR